MSGLFGGFYVNKLLDDFQTVLLRVLAEELRLGRDGEPLLFLLLTGYTGIDYGFHCLQLLLFIDRVRALSY